MYIYRCDILNSLDNKYFSTLKKAMDFVIDNVVNHYQDKEEIEYYYNTFMEGSGSICLFFRTKKDHHLYASSYIKAIEVEE